MNSQHGVNSNPQSSPSATTKTIEEILKVAYNYGRLYGILNKQGEHALNGLSAAINNLINQAEQEAWKEGYDTGYTDGRTGS